MKVTYRERHFLDKFRCIDREVSRFFIKKWEVSGLTYFKPDAFNVFVIATADIISISE